MMTKKYFCPQCKKEIIWENNPYRPFCSERCRQIDLGNWAVGKYRVPAEPFFEEEEITEIIKK